MAKVRSVGEDLDSGNNSLTPHDITTCETEDQGASPYPVPNKVSSAPGRWVVVILRLVLAFRTEEVSADTEGDDDHKAYQEGPARSTKSALKHPRRKEHGHGESNKGQGRRQDIRCCCGRAGVLLV